jgi:phage tail sheath protein FI
MSDFLHGVETTEILVGPRPITEVKSAIIGVIGTAPIHHVAAPPALSDPELFLSDRDNGKFGVDISGYSLPAALTAMQEEEAGTIIGINVFDPAVHKTVVAVTAKNIVDKKITLVADLISVTVTTAADAACVEGTDYTVDRVKGIVTILPGGQLAAAATAKVAYVRANPAAVVAADIIGATTNGVRTGLQAFLNAASKFGFGPKILIAPGFSDDATVKAALKLIVQKTKLRAVTFVDAPVGASRDDVIEGRGDAGTLDLTVADERVVLCYPRVKVGSKLEPLSQRAAGGMARTDRELGYWHSPSNKEIKGATGIETPLTAAINDPQCDVNALNAAGVYTVFTGYGRAPHTWGNRSSVFPGSSDITSFISVRRTLDVVDESVELATLTHIDGPATDVLITAVLEDVNAFVRRLVNRGALVPGSRVEFLAADNTADDLAAGHLTFTKTMCPPPPAERITYKSLVDVSLLKRS